MFDDNFDFSLPYGSDFGEHQEIDWNIDDVSSSWTQMEFSHNIYGGDGTYIPQTTDFTCAVVSQEMILHDFGINVSEAELVYDAASHGWLTDNGTSIGNMGKLLEYYGVSTHANYDGDIPSLVNELAHGHKVIVAVDSGELWNGQSFWQRLTGFDYPSPDHAIVIDGVDFSDPNHPQVIINDPGHSNGDHQHYPLDHFLEAWNDSNCTYVATDNAPSSFQWGSVINNETMDFWVNLGIVAIRLFATTFLSGNLEADYASTNYDSSWEALGDTAINQLFLEI
ncbi:MAG: C39 family peptidase [Planctomycetaceae bacterium]|jgi:hypothetical protein|nr:C39 family peptidase [Planctomycetaceae bacterium]